MLNAHCLREISDHPARFALVEIQNLHDPALHFEPIHRILWQCDPELLLKNFARHSNAQVEYNERAFGQVAESFDQTAIGVHMRVADGTRMKGVIRFPTGN